MHPNPSPVNVSQSAAKLLRPSTGIQAPNASPTAADAAYAHNRLGRAVAADHPTLVPQCYPRTMLLRRVQAALLLAQLASLFTFVRAAAQIPVHILAVSTACAAVGMFVGATAALRARTWGVGLVFASAVAFASAAALKMGPPFFWAVAAAGTIPMLLSTKPFMRFSRSATVLFALIAIAAGVGSALAWREIAPLILNALSRRSCA